MTTAQLINELQKWQEIHGVCKVFYQHTAMESLEHAILGCAMAEDDDGNMDFILFTDYQVKSGEAE